MTVCVCGAAFGSGSFGSFPWGSGYGLGICSASVSARNAIDVLFAGFPQAQDPGLPDDALNPANWTLSLREPFGCALPFVQAVEEVSANTIRVLLDADLCETATYRICVAANVISAFGTALDPACLCFDVDGKGYLAPRTMVPGRELRNDLQNPQVGSDAPGTAAPLGTFQLTKTGDLALERGIPYLRKRILRRASTMTGSFFHLPGYGFAPGLKTKITPSLLRNIQQTARAQILQEPDVVACEVSVTRSAANPNIVRITIRARAADGTAETAEVDIPIGEG